jgi:hypothetical protein
MTKLLNKYFGLETEYKEKPHSDFDELKEQNRELHKKQAFLLSQMSVKELTYLLGVTTGFMRSVIADYIKKAGESRPELETVATAYRHAHG